MTMHIMRLKIKLLEKFDTCILERENCYIKISWIKV